MRLGDLDASGLIALGYDTIILNTNATGPIPMSLTGSPDPATAALMQKLQPSVTLQGRLPTIHVAPYGEPSGGISAAFQQMGWETGIGIGAALLGLMIVGGVLMNRPRPTAKAVSGYRRRRRHLRAAA